VQLTFDREGADFPAWSPDGRWIAFQLNRGDSTQVAVIPAGGGESVQVTGTPGKNWPFSWAPDSDRIVYAGFQDGQWNLYWISRSTRAVRKLTDFRLSNGFVRYPSWSGDGRLILFERTESVGNIFVADIASARRRDD
jgi:TolB protein